MKFTNASEPTDIIWENRHYTRWDYIKRQTWAAIIIAVLLFGSFILVYETASFYLRSEYSKSSDADAVGFGLGLTWAF